MIEEAGCEEKAASSIARSGGNFWDMQEKWRKTALYGRGIPAAVAYAGAGQMKRFLV